MGRPRTVSDDAILDATIRAVEEVGPARMTLADVAREAGVSPSALVQRFGSKQALLVAVSTRAAGTIEPAFDDALARAGSPLTALLAVFTDLVTGIDSPATLANHIAFLQLDLVDPELRDQAQVHARAVLRGTKRALDGAVTAKQLKNCDTARLARALQTTFNGALVSWALTGRGPLRAWVRSELEFALAPYRRRPAPATR